MTQETQHAWRIQIEESWGDNFKYKAGNRQYKNEEGKWCVMVMLTVKPSSIAKTPSTVVINEIAENKISTIAKRSETTVHKKLNSQQPGMLTLLPELRSQIHPARLPREFIFIVLDCKNGKNSRLMRIESRSPQKPEEHHLVTYANKQLRRTRAN